MSKLSFVVPVYHNAETLAALHERFCALSAKIADTEFEFVFTDDGSGDSSGEVLRGLAAKDARVRVISLSRNFGSNAAILAGLTYCTGDAAAVISADLQDPPELIADLHAKWKEGNQVVMAARRDRQDPPLAKAIATATNRFIRRFVLKSFPPNGFDFMLIDRCVINLLVSLREKNSYIFGQTLWVGFKRAVIEYDRQERAAGKSQWTLSKKIKYFIDIVTSFSYLPIRFASLLGSLLALAGFIYAVLIVALRLFSGFPVQGWASLTVVVLLTSGVQLLLLGIVGEYLWRSLDETRKRPPFIVATAVNAEGARVPDWAKPAMNANR